MNLTNKLVKLAAKVALDKLIGETRTNELDAMLKDWAEERDKAKRLAEAKELAADSQAVKDVVLATIEESGASVVASGRENVEVTVAVGFALLGDPPSEDQIREAFLPGTMKTYVILSDDPQLAGVELGRFFHFSWYKDGWRVRDYLGGRILHPPYSQVGKEGLTPVSLQMSPLEVWNASRVRIHSVAEYGLGFATSEQDRWRKVLALLTESARQLDGR
jgi:hypothetical protein